MQGHSEVMSQGWAIGWIIHHHRVAQGRGLRSPRNSGTRTYMHCRLIGELARRSRCEAGGYRAERICHRIARTRLRGLLLNRGYQGVVSSHANCFRDQGVAIG